jgi:SAM-dependent methyltransferase
MSGDNIPVQCHICRSNAVFLFDSFAYLGRATSDCKPWPKGGKLCVCRDCNTVQKIPDSSWRLEVNKIYGNYELYHQSTDGIEQPVFNSETASSIPRSIAVLNYAKTVITIKDNIHAIDIGCGVGNMLKSMSQTLTTAKLYGFEPNAHKKKELEGIKNVAEIYTDIEQVNPSYFDLITMIHVLEHVESPLDFLKNLKYKIKPGGYLIVAVPDYTENPFDLIITDHATHFAMDTLFHLLLMSGFEILNISNKAINKEIIAICKVSSEENMAEKPKSSAVYNRAFVQKQLDWLAAIVAEVKNTVAINRPFGIFGTSIAANWVYGELAGNIDFFVDEDLDRVNKEYHQKPVYHASKIPPGSHTFVCLQPNVVRKVIERISSTDYFLYAPPIF